MSASGFVSTMKGEFWYILVDYGAKSSFEIVVIAVKS